MVSPDHVEELGGEALIERVRPSSATVERVLRVHDGSTGGSNRGGCMRYLGKLAARGLASLLLVSGCTTAGSTWMAQTPADADDEDLEPEDIQGTFLGAPELGADPTGRQGKVVDFPDRAISIGGAGRITRPSGESWDGKVLGTFRNTYYDFPNEAEYGGDAVSLRGPNCEVIAMVPKGFHDAVCVQGSGRLSSGVTVSFNRRDCSCADICPRTEQRICFDALRVEQYPWGRGATGNPITPLVTVAVDSSVIPMNTAVYIPEYDGLPRDTSQTSFHDGCFIAQDRGGKVQGNHVDIFTGQPSLTALWNKLVPSNQGVTVVLGSRRCTKAGVISSD